MSNKTIKIELTYSEIELFKKFCKHFEDFKRMVEADMFDFANGKKCVHRDKDKKMRRLTTEKVDFVC